MLKYLSRVTGSRKILVSCLILLILPLYLLPLKLSVIIINYLASTIFPKPPFLWFLLPTALPDVPAAGSSPPLLSCTSPSLPQLCAPYIPPQSSQFFNPFFRHSQPLIDLPKATTASHHFLFPLLLHLFCWSIRVGEDKREMKVGDSLSPCQVAAQRHRGVRHSWQGLKIC